MTFSLVRSIGFNFDAMSNILFPTFFFFAYSSHGHGGRHSLARLPWRMGKRLNSASTTAWEAAATSMMGMLMEILCPWSREAATEELAASYFY